VLVQIFDEAFSILAFEFIQGFLELSGGLGLGSKRVVDSLHLLVLDFALVELAGAFE